MKRFLRWIAGVLGLVLALALLPYASRWLHALLPDPGKAYNVSATLSQKLEASARMETNRLAVDGVLVSSVNALLIGEVQHVQIAYAYEASLGIDLTKVQVRPEGGTIVLRLPSLEILSDSLTPTHIDRQDFWYPLSEKRRAQLLEDERIARREKHLAEYRASDAAWKNTVSALDRTIAGWLSTEGVTLRYEPMEAQP